MQHKSVKNLFKEQVEHYSKKDQAINSRIIPLVLEWLKNKKVNRKINICEFGGGAGQLLKEIERYQFSGLSISVVQLMTLVGQVKSLIERYQVCELSSTT